MTTRKFHVEFDVETNEAGFRSYGSSGWKTAVLSHGISSVEVLPNAKITEIRIMEDGYYYGAKRSAPNTRFLHKRANGKWFFRDLSNGWAGLTASDEDHQDNLYLGPLRGDDTV